MKNQKGFSLLEVVAAFVLITIILLSFYPLINNAKKVSASNIERFVVINLAEATLNRLKLSYDGFIEKPTDNPLYLFKNNGKMTYKYQDCGADKCENYKIELNQKVYFFEIVASQKDYEAEIGIINIIVTAKNQKGNINYSVEGYISYNKEGNNVNEQ